MARGSNNTKCVSLSNQKNMTQPTLINLHPNEYSRELHYYPLAVKCKTDGRKCNSNHKWNNNKCRCECKKHHIFAKDYIWNPATCCCKNVKYLAGIIDGSVITCDEIIEAKNKNYSNKF